MELTEETRVSVRIVVPATGDLGEFSDALHFTPEERAELTDAQLEQMARERYDNWVAAVTAPAEPAPEPEPVSEEDRQAQLEQMREQTVALLAQIEQALAQEPTATDA